MTSPAFTTLLVPTLILVAGVINDLWRKKVFNWISLTLIVVAGLYVAVFKGLAAFPVALLGAGLALALTLVFVMAKIMGGGDMKLFIAFGLATDMTAVFYTFIFSFIWGALLGVIKAFLDGQGLDLLKNTLQVAVLKKQTNTELHRIPYTVALLFGWFTHLTLQGVSLW